MGLFGGNDRVKTTFVGDDQLSPVVRNVRTAISGFKSDMVTGLGVGAGFNLFSLAQSAISGVLTVLPDLTQAWRDDQASQATLQAALQANIDKFDGNTTAIENLITARENLGFSDDSQRQSLAQLVAITKDSTAALNIQRIAMDLARLKGIDLETASLALGKAYEGQTTALARMGIKLAAGTSGMAALEEVSKRVNGQAEAFAKTGAGAIETFNVKVGELQEHLGGALMGPASMFLTWASNVVDVLDGPDGANKALRDLASQIYSVKQAVSPTNEQLLANMTDQLQRWQDTLTQQEFSGTPESFAWLQRLGPSVLRNFGDASADTLADVRALAQSFIDTGQYSEAGFQQFRSAVEQLATPSFNVLTDTWGSTASAIKKGAGTVRAAFHGLPSAMTHAVVDMETTINQGKADITEQFRLLAWQSKHPFANTNYAKWLRGQQTDALDKMKQAVKDGRPDLVEQYRQMVFDIQAELKKLPGTATRVTNAVNSILSAVATINAGHSTNVPSHAIGGTASGTFVAGEYGPEVINIGSAKANVQTAQASRGNGGNVYLDGALVGRWMDRWLGRQLEIA